MTTQQATPGYNVNPLVGLTREETLSNCQEFLDHMAQTGEDLPYGHSVNVQLLRGALGHELAQVAKKEGGEGLDRRTG